MSNSDQQRPYGQEPGTGTGYGYGNGLEPQSYGQQVPYDQNQAVQDPGVAQTWEGQTWDTQYQPAVQPTQQPQQPEYGQPQQYAQPQYEQPYAQQYAQPQYEQPYAQQYAQPQHGQPYAQQHEQPQHGQPQYEQPQYEQSYPAQAPQQPVAAAAGPAVDAGYPIPQGASGSYPLPPEVPAAAPVPAAAAAQDASGYTAPTTLGNSRITDAQRARAEGRSPIIAPGMQPAAITAGLGLLLALGAAIGQYALFVPLVLLQAVTAAGWFRLNGMWPARQGIALAFAGGFVADVVLLVAGRDNAPAAILGTLGIWVLLTVVLQLRSHAGADERMYGLMATVASAALAILAAGHLAAAPDAVTVGCVAVAVAVLARALPVPGPASVVVALLAAAGAGVAAGGLTDLGAKGAFLGFAAGGCALIGLRVASYDYPSRFVHMTAGVALPLTAAAPAVYLIGRAVS
ncbi:hypothetical protein OHA79_25540 [Streptomyces sp. NBC_00841]|uniref:hypothetical protein n=1 Tax=unclassified Streptomyces TaxID=2593676 RepID=UPI0022593138|nr:MULTISPECIES: hypothetical protein [unclassified Streptomyces]MCX4533699.1 hypothetical protein [Streptomyces sp. NBC_01669]WSA00900.1 hypothetical protein OHA79_25540 [Streptomyces sp. NBC_00841]